MLNGSQDPENSQPNASECDASDAPQSQHSNPPHSLVFELASWAFWPYSLAFQVMKWSIQLPLEVARGVLFEQADVHADDWSSSHNDSALTASDAVASTESTYRDFRVVTLATSMASNVLLTPVRMVSSGVSMAVAVPIAVVCFGGRQVSKAVQTSQQLAVSATTATARGVTDTTWYVAKGVTRGVVNTVSATANTCAGIVGSSVQIASNVIPDSVADTFWHRIESTSRKSTSVVSYLVAMPTYRLMTTVYPELQDVFDEETCVQSTQQVVSTLVRVLGPQNAFYVIKLLYQTVKSDETRDMLLLCRDVASESVNKENYKQLGKTIGKQTRMTDLYNLLPSFDELLDVAYLVGDVSEEIVEQMQHSSRRHQVSDSDQEREEEQEHALLTFDTFGFEAPTSSTSTNWFSEEEVEYFVDEPPESLGFIIGEDAVFHGEVSYSDDDSAPPPSSNSTQISLFSEGEKNVFFIDEPPQSMGFIEDCVVFEAPDEDMDDQVDEQDTIHVKEAASSKAASGRGLVDSGIGLLTDLCDSERTFQFFNEIGNVLDEIID